MGSPLGPILANIFVGYYENNLLSLDNSKPLTYYRYFDDVFVILKTMSITFLFCLIRCTNTDFYGWRNFWKNSFLGQLKLLEIATTHFLLLCTEKKILVHTKFPGTRFAQPKKKLKILQCITNKAIKICTADWFDLEMHSIFKVFCSLGYSETVIKKIINATQSKINRSPSFGPHPCQVYFHFHYMCEN